MTSSLKIAQVAPIVERVPPKTYGGTERIVHTITEELIKMGHEVTLFASGDSQTSAKLISVYPRSLREAKFTNLYGPNELTLLNIGLAYQMQGQFDIIHDHCAPISLPTANLSKTPVVVTMHGAISAQNKRLFQTLANPNVISISKSQISDSDDFNHLGTVYHGLNYSGYPFSENSDGYLLYVGRLSYEKGVHLAIEAAQYLDTPLILAAKLDSIDMEYFKHYIEPRLSDERIVWIGEVDDQKRNQLMSRALCFLHPVVWEEPFGLTLIEALGCGCPVIAMRRGSIPEVIKDGKTGYVVSNVNELIRAITKIKNISRVYCREYAVKNFSAAKMAKNYVKYYLQVLSQSERYSKKYKTPYSPRIGNY